MINVLQQVTTAHENIRARLSSKARYGIILLLAIIALILLIFEAEWLMQHMIALLPIVYVGAFLAIGLKRAIYGTILFVFFSFALWLRVGPPYDYVLGGEWVVFGGNDPWFHMRLVENLVSHFPQQISFDSYTYYPYGQELFFAPFFDWLLALIVWVVGLGHPSIELIEKIGAYFPAILGALVTIPVYFIGKELFNRNMGLIAAGLLAIAPGEFLFRSLLGFTDHHVAEVLFSTTAILFLILAIKRARETRPTFSHLKDKDWGTLKKPLLYSLLTGFTLGIYLLSWVGGLLFILIIFAYLVIQYIIDHLRGESTDYLCIIGTPMFLLSFIIFSPFWKDVLFAKDAMIALPIAIFTPIALSILSRLMSRYSLRKVYYPPAVILLALVAAGIFYLIDSSIFHSVLNRFIVFTPTVTTKTIMEGQPFFNDFTISNLLDHRIWDYFTTGFVTAPIAFLLLIYSAFSKAKVCKYILLGLGCLLLLTVIIDQVASVPWQLYLSEFIATLAIYAYLERNPARTLFIIWSAIILVAMLGQTRFAYYIAVNVALLSGYLLWRIPG
ncbi:MAG: STT3 domain-containing protein, partial [Chloroflexota bacterium]|nr:STT3 domain-containing protein [Chloroflexota bacterium]